MRGFENIPFQIFRTHKGKKVPVYTNYKNENTRFLTLIHRFCGDAHVLSEEMSRVLDIRRTKIRSGLVETFGNYHGRVTELLQRL